MAYHNYDAWGNRYEDVGPRVKRYGYNGEDDPEPEPWKPSREPTEREKKRAMREMTPYSERFQTTSWERGPDGAVESGTVPEERGGAYRQRMQARRDAEARDLVTKLRMEREAKEGGDARGE